MPLYEYIALQDGCEHCLHGFEMHQKMSDAALTQCPECKNPVEKCISAVSIARENPKLLSRKNLEKNGFVRYERAKGGYVKTAGTQGPEFIKKAK